MSTGTRINDSQGIVQRANSNSCNVDNQLNANNGVVVEQNSNNQGVSPYKIDKGASLTSPLTTAFSVTHPGFYWVSGTTTTTTGTLPVASDHPGATFAFNTVATGKANFTLTGSSRSTGASTVFCRNGAGAGAVSGSVVGGGSASGDALTVPASGSVVLVSDGLYWIPTASSGTLNIGTGI